MKQCINEASDILTFIERDIDEDMKESRVKQEESGEIKPVIHLKVNKGLCPSTVFNDDRKVACGVEMITRDEAKQTIKSKKWKDVSSNVKKKVVATSPIDNAIKVCNACALKEHKHIEKLKKNNNTNGKKNSSSSSSSSTSKAPNRVIPVMTRGNLLDIEALLLKIMLHSQLATDRADKAAVRADKAANGKTLSYITRDF